MQQHPRETGFSLRKPVVKHCSYDNIQGKQVSVQDDKRYEKASRISLCTHIPHGRLYSIKLELQQNPREMVFSALGSKWYKSELDSES